jgi:hypothetical protein
MREYVKQMEQEIHTLAIRLEPPPAMMVVAEVRIEGL